MSVAVSGEWLLRVEALVSGYGGAKVLHGVDLVVGEGETVVVLGANGAGKTTLLRALSGMIEHEGRIEFDGRPWDGVTPEEAVRRGVAHVPQGRGTLADLTVEENLRVGAFVRKDGEVEEDMRFWFEVFPRLRERRRQPAGSMSGGEQQMLAIARALMSRPKLLLLDEPSLGLAPLVTKELFETLKRIREVRRTAMLLVEQNAKLALELASRGYVLETGRIVMEATARELEEDEAVRKSYLGY
ncbi:MAG: ABC transporter ATP-binding protein [Acidimicrobiales bacterium]|nr:MAG: ABC transporter ATP-binding protein [Acidimicrobiales bacterium]